jgi:two-component system chemotaxis response regulator CheB
MVFASKRPASIREVAVAHRNVIVVGASLGGHEALAALIGTVPADLNAAVFVVMHVAPDAPNILGQLLERVSPFPAAPAVDGEPIAPNRIYVAVPDRHLMIEGDRVRLSRGPRESHARPSIDVLFRSAAFHRGPRAIGIVLTGTLDDGTAGLWAINDRGGIAIVQAPTEAPYPSMPMSAIRHVDVDHVLEVAAMGTVLRELTHEDLSVPEGADMPSKSLEIESRIALGDVALQQGVRALGQPSFHTCPDCHGSMIAIKEGDLARFRCHTGHGYTAAALHQRGMLEVDETLWGALAQLEEQEVLLQDLARAALASERPEADEAYATKSKQLRQLADRLRELAQDPALEPHSSLTEERAAPQDGGAQQPPT